MSEQQLAASMTNDACVVCGPANPHGLQIRFETPEPGRVCAAWTPSAAWEGFHGVTHGGIVSTVLDEAMSKSVSSMGWAAMTCELRVRLSQSVVTGECVRIRGWVVERNRRKITAEACVDGPGGKERAHAWAVFLVVPPLNWTGDAQN